jgi:hypothetical protein
VNHSQVGGWKGVLMGTAGWFRGLKGMWNVSVIRSSGWGNRFSRVEERGRGKFWPRETDGSGWFESIRYGVHEYLEDFCL